ncbi:MAG: isoprenoid biosynthesis glyoxalase ElbB [Armatimonadetes bacterium]|nr:isoprenoid biosynthesis glyoxalase ElbB [Armatimonadota bacterium]
MAKVGVLLSGCGFKDGAEIHESVLTLLALDEAGAEIVCMAPDVPQARVVNFLTGEETGETRNVLVESARIARGEIRDVKDVKAAELDALIIPGGYGAVTNLCDFGAKGADATVHNEVQRLIQEVAGERKPIGAICIAPALIAAAIKGVTLTIGNDAGTAGTLEKMGACHEKQPVEGITVDETNRVVTTPAYMLGPGPKDINKGIRKLVDRVLSMIPVKV